MARSHSIASNTKHDTDTMAEATAALAQGLACLICFDSVDTACLRLSLLSTTWFRCLHTENAIARVAGHRRGAARVDATRTTKTRERTSTAGAAGVGGRLKRVDGESAGAVDLARDHRTETVMGLRRTLDALPLLCHHSPPRWPAQASQVGAIGMANASSRARRRLQQKQ